MVANVQRPISIPEPTNNVDALWSSVKALKEAVETIQGIRGNREYALETKLLDEINDLEQQIDAIAIASGVVSFNSRSGAVVPLQADYDSFFLTQAEGDAIYEDDLGNPAANGYHLVSTTGGVRTWEAVGGGINNTPLEIIGDINTATPPTTEVITAELHWKDLANDDVLATAGPINGNTFYLINRMHGGDMQFQVENSSGSAQQVFRAVADGGGVLMWQGNDQFATTADGVRAFGKVHGETLYLDERANADDDVPGDGQVWVKFGTPNTLWFTDDDGNDIQLGVGEATPTHIGEVTGDASLTLDVTAITNRNDVTAESADDVAIHDNSDGLIKKVNLSSITDGGYF